MINVSANVLPEARELAGTAREHLDALVSYATHLVYDPGDAVDFVTAGIYHASRYPPARLRVDGRAALYRAVTRACRQELRYPPRPHGPARLFQRRASTARVPIDGSAAARMNTVKRALAMLNFDRRAALLMRDLAGLDYREISRALECSPDATARLIAGARREFGSIYREIAL
ncbi:MAG TPA: sigma-70 family RNA polymerase sigma factor [Steroidobacteraceae bacterium]|jgi:DNA-directed RNA polymerase specialized sigma24 family protein|nr:sigma-70 family RNA polymerase sigma factor [Steroidobacteraceae bacterium]